MGNAPPPFLQQARRDVEANADARAELGRWVWRVGVVRGEARLARRPVDGHVWEMTEHRTAVPDDVLEQRTAVVAWLRDTLGARMVLTPVYDGTPGWVARVA